MAALIAYRDIKLSTKLMLAIEFASDRGAIVLLIVGLAMLHNSVRIDRDQLHLEGVPGFQVFSTRWFLDS